MCISERHSSQRRSAAHASNIELDLWLTGESLPVLIAPFVTSAQDLSRQWWLKSYRFCQTNLWDGCHGYHLETIGSAPSANGALSQTPKSFRYRLGTPPSV